MPMPRATSDLVSGLYALASIVMFGCLPPTAPAPNPITTLPAASSSAQAVPEPQPVLAGDASLDAFDLDSASEPDTALPAPAAVSDPQTFSCGTGQTCRSNVQVCCVFQGSKVCVQKTPQNQQAQACMAAMRSKDLEGFDECDESIDCPGGQVCCDELYNSGGPSVARCTKLPASGESPCDFGELCAPSSPCRTPGTVCLNGSCLKPVTDLKCGNATCGKATPVCCSKPLGCVKTARECDQYSAITCERQSDCAKGTKCMVQEGGAFCVRRWLNYQDPHPACDRDSDCRGLCSLRPRLGAKCVQSAIPWMKMCQLDDLCEVVR